MSVPAAAGLYEINTDPVATENLLVSQAVVEEGRALGTGQHTDLVRDGRSDEPQGHLAGAIDPRQDPLGQRLGCDGDHDGHRCHEGYQGSPLRELRNGQGDGTGAYRSSDSTGNQGAP